jgi:hypothetical protein
MTEAWTRKEFEEKLKEKGRLYHIHHPYQVSMNSGKSNKAQIQGWVANRFYYQTTIPIKDASIMANCSERDVRRQWMQRILDHDGVDGDDGGIEAWLRLGESVGMSRQEIQRCLSKFCPQSELARSSVFIADRIICSRNSPKKAKYLARSLPLDRHRRLPIFQKALIGSPPRRATWTGYYPGAFQNEGTAGASPWHPPI